MSKSKLKVKNTYTRSVLFLCLILTPILYFLYSYNVYHGNRNQTIYLILFIVTLLFLFVSFISVLLNRKDNPMSRDYVSLLFLVIGLSIIGLGVDLSIYGKYDGFRNKIIELSMGSVSYQGIAKYLYPDGLIEKYVNKDAQVLDLSEDIIDDDLVTDKEIYESKEYKDVLTHEEGAIYKIIDITGTNYNGSTYTGKMVAVYDPANVTLSVSPGIGLELENSSGRSLLDLAKQSNALVAMNAGGFYDPTWNTNGGVPHGPLIHDGKLLTDFRRGLNTGGMVALTYDNKLVLTNWTGEEAINNNVRDAVDWGPFLIVNGKNQFKGQVTTWNTCRTAVGQRADGIILLVAISGHPSVSAGINYSDMATLFEKYGAINAGVMDSGASTQLVEKGEHILVTWNGNKSVHRWLPNAWVVVDNSKKEE